MRAGAEADGQAGSFIPSSTHPLSTGPCSGHRVGVQTGTGQARGRGTPGRGGALFDHTLGSGCKRTSGSEPSGRTGPPAPSLSGHGDGAPSPGWSLYMLCQQTQAALGLSCPVFRGGSSLLGRGWQARGPHGWVLFSPPVMGSSPPPMHSLLLKGLKPACLPWTHSRPLASNLKQVRVPSPILRDHWDLNHATIRHLLCVRLQSGEG